jgi:hypothetical protein
MDRFASLKKLELHALADRLLVQDADAVEQCVSFFEAESGGLWHGRARAMMARRFKHCALTDRQRRRIIEAIVRRLTTGAFSEQFKDQLRLGLDIGHEEIIDAARQSREHPAPHVRRYAVWVLSRARTR